MAHDFIFDDDINSEQWAKQYDFMLNTINEFVNTSIDTAVELNKKLDISDDQELNVNTILLPASA